MADPRHSSSFPSRGSGASAYADVLDLLECPVCFETIYSPIYQCPNGHTLCSQCKPNVNNSCPTCRCEMGDIRSLALEKLAASIQLPCRHQNIGCTELVPFDTKQNHEQACKFRPYKCPFPCSPCSFAADIPILLTHLQSFHESSYQDSSGIDTLCRHAEPYNGQNASSNVNVYNCLGQHFCLHFEAFYSPLDLVYMAFVTFMGDEIEAMNYRYRLEIGNELWKMSWQGIPRSIREHMEQVRESHDGLIIHRDVAQNFSEINTMEELTLRVKGLIWKEQLL